MITPHYRSRKLNPNLPCGSAVACDQRVFPIGPDSTANDTKKQDLGKIPSEEGGSHGGGLHQVWRQQPAPVGSEVQAVGGWAQGW